jgi:hypothetical protein
MSPRLDAAPPTDRGMWRRLFKRCHPDHGGEHALFIWVHALYDHVRGDALEDARTAYQRRQPPAHPATGERIDYTAAYSAPSFGALTHRALRIGDEAGEPFASILRQLMDCAESYEIRFSRQQQQGATYKSLAAIAHTAGLTSGERTRWYRVAESVPLSQRHAGHILSKLKRAAA